MSLRVCLVTVGCMSVGAGLTATEGPTQTFQFASVQKAAGDPCQSAQCIVVPGLSSGRPAASIAVFPGGRFEARAQTIESLVRVAYGFEYADARRGVVDGTRIPEDRFDITALTREEWTTPLAGETTPAELRPMLRALLEERFGIETRLETRKIDVYALRLSSKTGQPGPGLRPSTRDCLGPYTDPQPSEPDQPKCAFRVDTEGIEAGAVTMPDVARLITRISTRHADRVIVDQTGLQGTYDVMLSMKARSRVPIPVEPGSERPLNIQILGDSRWPIEVSEAIERQLGLKLQKASLPIPTLIIVRTRTPRVD